MSTHIKICRDCGAKEGQLHKSGCDMEKCPFCGGQLILCGCCYRHFYPEYTGLQPDRIKILPNGSIEDRGHPTNGLPKEVYENGLPADQDEEWERILEEKGRVPYIVYPNLCCRCGELWPEMFSVPNEEWDKYVQISMTGKILCRRCYDEIKRLIDTRGETHE